LHRFAASVVTPPANNPALINKPNPNLRRTVRIIVIDPFKSLSLYQRNNSLRLLRQNGKSLKETALEYYRLAKAIKAPQICVVSYFAALLGVLATLGELIQLNKGVSRQSAKPQSIAKSN
jgi:hypothetical protein